MIDVKIKPQSGIVDRGKSARHGLSPTAKQPEKKQQSPFKSFKNTLLLRNHKSRKSSPKTVNSTPADSIPDINVSPLLNGPSQNHKSAVKGSQRFSAQRVTLFKYNHVRVVNSVTKGHRSSSESSMSSALTSHSTVLRRHDSHEYSIASAETRRETCLMSDGPLEIYQIITYNSSKLPSQKMTYLCLGRKDNILHPILPKLQVTKLPSPQFKISILLLNPERYWIIEFLPEVGHSEVRDEVRVNFESMISTICSYKVHPNPAMHQEETGHSQNKLLKEDNHSDTEEDSDLEYLLNESDSFLEETESTNNDESHDRTVNDAFRNAIRNIMVSESYDTKRVSGSKRLSSYHSTTVSSRFEPRLSMVRSASVQMRLRASYDGNSPLGVGTWMDVGSEDSADFFSRI
ncbi:LAME_0H14400g1_1 [Lachancea meyersii CBS 8951]|uniref:Inheritance of peroxisomes protein 1 n=1 Tax=Lachancea meyersii CBS 8951 TaxID=1266667 RepID=A0A1G4KHI6_9SACH|nr:LAME_0H14400g1_1 [Lachancea meyersii CBS 8951]